jgi:hypothetical protein
MDPTEILAMAQNAAQLIRIASDSEKALVSAYSVFDRKPPMDHDEPFAIRIARLMTEAGDHRRDVLDYLRTQTKGLLLNRPSAGQSKVPQEQEMEADPEALKLVEYVEGADENGREIFPESFGAFGLAHRSMLATFGGRTVIERDGKRLSPEEAGALSGGDRFHFEKEGLPSSVRGLIDYPLQVPVLFTIEPGEEPWSVWDICCAFADQYAVIYEHPQRYGIWGHDLTDLCLERLLFFPEKKLIYPHIGS